MKPFGRVSRRCTSAICLIALLATSLAHAYGQQTPSKRALTHQDYDSWRSIQAPQISRDGKFVAYAFMAQDGDSEIVVRNLASGAEWRAPRGYRPPAPPPDDPGANVAEFIAAQGRLVRPGGRGNRDPAQDGVTLRRPGTRRLQLRRAHNPIGSRA